MPLNQKPRGWEAGLWVEGLARFRSLRWAGPQMPQGRRPGPLHSPRGLTKGQMMGDPPQDQGWWGGGGGRR